MRAWAIALFLAAASLPSFAASQVTVEQLEKALSAAHSRPDAEVARQIAALELTERLTWSRFAQLKSALPGIKSQEALLALSDLAAFLPPSAADVPATATPTPEVQRRMMARTVDYLAKTLPLLPNLFAARDTVRFESRLSAFDADLSVDTALRPVSRSNVTVLYRNGREYIDAAAGKNQKAQEPDRGLTTWGEFGPILGTVVLDAAHSKLAWSHWELGPAGPQAVFGYTVPKDKSHYDVRFCCMSQSYGLELEVLTERAGYHGEITVDPASGTILRLTVLADLLPESPISHAAIAVEYGPVEIGGQTYYCPIRGIAVAQSPDLKILSSALNPLAAGVSSAPPTLSKDSLATLSRSSRQMLLNDVAFHEFHLFRSEARVVPEKGADSTTQASAPLQTEAAPVPVPASVPEGAVDSAVYAAPAAPSPLDRLQTTAKPSTQAAASAAAPALPEISVLPVTGLPDSPSLPAASTSDATVTLRLSARLVDLPVVALDKKGHPLTNLKPEDFEIYDDGHKVPLSSFGLSNASPPEPEPATAAKAPATGSQPAYSNRRTATAPANKPEAQVNTLVFLLDNNLSFDDLTNTRTQMIGFLDSLHENERVALYTMRRGGFQILRETSTDHHMLATALAKWTPSPDAVALGQEQEARNRQTMETVHSLEDLLAVNGHTETDPSLNDEALDANLRELGDRPGQDALSGLTEVARHLASISGHKSLVWIASDNVLADWTNASISISRGDKIIDRSVLRTQEAMNDAHVSVYPLDVSRLEGGTTDAGIGTRNVEVVPTNLMQNLPLAEASMHGPEWSAGADVNTKPNRDLNPGRALSQLHQDVHPIHGAFREIAEATGGRVFRRASDLVSEFKTVAEDGRATYLISFKPAEAADGKYHLITVKVANRRDVTLHYRTGFMYRQGASTLKDRFQEAVWQPQDAGEIALAADPLPGSGGRTLKLSIAATDLALSQTDSFWTDKLDVYLVQREVAGTKAHITGEALGLRLTPATYQQYLRDGIPFTQPIDAAPGTGSVRVVVLDENSGRMGSLTVPGAALAQLK